MTEATDVEYLVLEKANPQAPGIAARLESMGAGCQVAHTKVDALERVTRSSRLAGVVLDIAFPDGPLDVLAWMRDSEIFTPALLVAPASDATSWATAQRHGAYVLPKPVHDESLAAFLHWTRRQRENARARLAEEVRAFGARHGLTAREREILRLAASGIGRHELTSALSVEESTIKTMVRRLLRKARRSTLSEVVSEVHRAIFLVEERATSDGPVVTAAK